MKITEEKNIYEDRLKKVYRGEVWYAELPKFQSSVQGGGRPVLVISNNACNKYSSVVTVIPITTKFSKRKDLPTHVSVMSDEGVKNTLLCEQVQSIDRKCIKKLLYKLDEEQMKQVEECLKIQLGITILRREHTNEVSTEK